MKKLNTQTTGVKKSNSVVKNILAACLLAVTFSNVYAISDAMRIKISSTTLSDETVIRFMPNATNSFDGSYDAWKLFSSNSSAPNLFTQIDSNSKLAINAMPELTCTRKVYVYLKISIAGYYLIKGDEIGAFASGIGIIMKDNATGQVYDLRSNNTYLIYLPVIAEDQDPRFEVTFIPAAIVKVYGGSCTTCTDGKLTIKKHGYKNWQYTVRDAAGIVATAVTSTDSATIYNLAVETYTVTINTSYGLTESIIASVTNPNATGLPENNNLKAVNIWSAGNYFMVEASFSTSTYLSVMVFDLSGKRVANFEFNDVQNMREELPLNEASSGLYVAVAQANGLGFTKKLVKTN